MPYVQTYPHTIAHDKWVNVDWFSYNNNKEYREHVKEMLQHGFKIQNPQVN
jgi:hypothetical protein